MFKKVIISVFALPLIASAQGSYSALLDGNGKLSISANSVIGINVSVTCNTFTSNININGLDPDNGIQACNTITNLQADGSVSADTIDFSQVLKNNFPNLKKTMINGGQGDDTLRGSYKKDVINGAEGSDLIYGNDGKDTIKGRTGNDTIHGGRGNDKIFGASGNDTIFGNAGKDKLNGSSGNDKINGGSGNDKITGGSGNDRLNGGPGKDCITTGSGNDRVKSSETCGGNGSFKLPKIPNPFR